MNNVVSLDDLFHKRVFRVPDYQRGYSWEERQVQEFLEDLELIGPSQYHYTGTVVLHELRSEPHRMDDSGNNYASVEIVDGQQRLTTIVLLLDGISSSLSEFSEDTKNLSNGIKKNYVAARATNGQPLYKVSLNEDTDHFFKENILSRHAGVEGPQITSEKRLTEAKQYIDKYLDSKSDLTATEKENWLQSLYTKITTQLRFTLYHVENEAEVGVIFEVMNDRGKPLTELEKVKNYLLHTSTFLQGPDEPNELATSVNGAWAEILRQLMAADLVSSADEDRLLRAHWLAHYDPQSRQWGGNKSIKDRFALRDYKDDPGWLLEHLKRYTEGLRASSISFCDAYRPRRSDAFHSFKADPDVRFEVVEWSAKLVRIGVVATFLPLLLAARDRWPEDPVKYLKLLKLCEAFAFRVYRLEGWRVNAGQSELFRIGYELANRKIGFWKMETAIKSELGRKCGNDSFMKLTSNNNPDDWYNWRGLRYFLYEYETALARNHGVSPKVSWEELQARNLQETIEHILPQTISDQRYWKSRFSQTRHGKYIHDLGNLTLTMHNSHYQNKPFPKKKGEANAEQPCYMTSPLYIERELARWNHWDASAIDKRRAVLLEWARNRWAVDLSGVGDDKYESGSIDEEYEGDVDLIVDDEEA